ncbi:unnamed protein product [Bursaphelenchus xylophilus]|uniref:(pine wood nematode) hypothetical protein n=1 Tax=Bursaphelenchus xylophilus TaxID=6326 RepID=A0A1I7SUX1_BURXY|nr:unnamed protein product [Bursaphelenchus xylophilus]CAG9125791.1 unnamed protein product [Bursaphelenchus xylophilus]
MAATRCQLRWALRLTAFAVFLLLFYVRQFLIDNLWPAKPAPEECLCGGENFCFKGVDDDGRIVFGKKFPCTEENLRNLKKLSLLQEDIDSTEEFQHLIGHGWQPTIITYGTEKTFGYLKKMAMNTAKYYPAGRIIVYDFGFTEAQKKEMRWWCNCYTANFTLSEWPESLQQMGERAYQFVLVDAMDKFDSIIYADPTTRFKVENAGVSISLIDYLFKIKFSFLPTSVPLTMTTQTVASITHRGMYEYFPIPYQATQMTAMSGKSMFLIDSKYTREMMKWWYLCSTTPECLAPQNSTDECKEMTDNPSKNTKCHHHAESFWNVYEIAHLFGEQKAAVRYGYAPRWSELTPALIERADNVRAALLRKLTIDRVEYRYDTKEDELHLPCMGERPWFGWFLEGKQYETD